MSSSSVTLVNRDFLLNAIALHFTIYSQKAELDDIKRGMDDVLGVSPLARSHATLFKPLLFLLGCRSSKLIHYSMLTIHYVEATGGTRRSR